MPKPRSGLCGGCQMNEPDNLEVVIFGGAGENNEKYNDLWCYSSKTNQWEEMKPQQSATIPVERAGPQGVIYKEKYLCIFGGIQEITNELNDFYVFDMQAKAWYSVS